MKKMVLGFSLALAALGFLVSPTMAAPEMSAADKAFISSLAAPGAPAPVSAAKHPGLGEKALCNASANCWNGTTVSCSGNNSTTSCSATDSNCSAHQRGSVTCDGVTTSCPACPCDLNCTEARAECADLCSPCPAITTCSLSTCTSTCRCKFSSCPL
jgi:hypothetical protein